MSLEFLAIIAGSLAILAGVAAHAAREVSLTRRQDIRMADLNSRLTDLGWRVE